MKAGNMRNKKKVTDEISDEIEEMFNEFSQGGGERYVVDGENIYIDNGIKLDKNKKGKKK